MSIPAIGAVITIGITGALLISLHSENTKEKQEASMAKNIVNNGIYLQKALNGNNVKNRASLIRNNEMPISSLIVKDHEYTEEDINAFSKNYEATFVLLQDNPNLEEAELTCSLLASTNKVTFDECQSIEGKKFKMYSITNDSLNYDISENSQKVQEYAKRIQSHHLNINTEELTLKNNSNNIENKTTQFSIPLSIKESPEVLTQKHQRDMVLRSEFEKNINNDKLVSASSKLKEIGAISDNKLLVIELTNSLSEKIIESEENKVNPENTKPIEVIEEEIKMATANFVNIATKIREKEINNEFKEETESISFLESLPQLPKIQEVINKDIGKNNYINPITKNKFNSFFR